MRIDRSEALTLKLAVYDFENSGNRFFTEVKDIHDKQECRDCAIYDLSLDELMEDCYCSTFTFLLWHPEPEKVENFELVDFIIGEDPMPGALCDVFDKLGFNYMLDDTDGFDLELNYQDIF